MKTTNKQHPVYQYMIDAIDGEGYDKTLNTTEEKLQFVLDTFRAEYDWRIKRDGEYKAFTEWLQGLPSSFNIDYTNYDILRLAREWDSLPDDSTELQEDKIISNWFNFIMVKFFQLCKRYKVQ